MRAAASIWTRSASGSGRSRPSSSSSTATTPTRATPEALEEITTVRANLKEVAVGMNYFARAKSQFDADQALKGIIRPFNRARDASVRLSECCPVPEGAVKLPPLEAPAAAKDGQ